MTRSPKRSNPPGRRAERREIQVRWRILSGDGRRSVPYLVVADAMRRSA